MAPLYKQLCSAAINKSLQFGKQKFILRLTMTETTPMTATALATLQLAVELCTSQAELARRIGRKPQEVWNWLNRDSQAPIDACAFIEAACSDPRVTCESLRPDYDGWVLLRRGTGLPAGITPAAA
jgi:DNA-binding transcriptional regulator YdaS (Cro superfamily)